MSANAVSHHELHHSRGRDPPTVSARLVIRNWDLQLIAPCARHWLSRCRRIAGLSGFGPPALPQPPAVDAVGPWRIQRYRRPTPARLDQSQQGHRIDQRSPNFDRGDQPIVAAGRVNSLDGMCSITRLQPPLDGGLGPFLYRGERHFAAQCRKGRSHKSFRMLRVHRRV